MSEPSDDADRAWDEDPKDEPATSGEGEVHRVDTVPPPASGDAYSADTVIRDVPREALDAIRERRKNSEKRRAAEAAPKEPAAEKKAEAKPAEEPKEEPNKVDSKSSPAAVETVAAEKPAPKKASPLAAHSPAHTPKQTKVIEPPVTVSELTIALAAAIALIVIGFYVIGSAF
jgi:FtsZ-interacting cell division protein ZipA